jgi:hypothetical protein
VDSTDFADRARETKHDGYSRHRKTNTKTAHQTLKPTKAWRRSRHSGYAGDNCVEIALIGTPDSGILYARRKCHREWQAMTLGHAFPYGA